MNGDIKIKMVGKRSYRLDGNICEHCDCTHDDDYTRYDILRGWICPWCDEAFDEIESVKS